MAGLTSPALGEEAKWSFLECGAVVARVAHNHEVAGSIPAAPILPAHQCCWALICSDSEVGMTKIIDGFTQAKSVHEMLHEGRGIIAAKRAQAEWDEKNRRIALEIERNALKEFLADAFGRDIAANPTDEQGNPVHVPRGKWAIVRMPLFGESSIYVRVGRQHDGEFTFSTFSQANGNSLMFGVSHTLVIGRNTNGNPANVRISTDRLFYTDSLCEAVAVCCETQEAVEETLEEIDSHKSACESGQQNFNPTAMPKMVAAMKAMRTFIQEDVMQDEDTEALLSLATEALDEACRCRTAASQS